MKRKITYALLILALCILLFTFASCAPVPETPTPDPAPDLSGISLEDKTVEYNGEAHTLAVTGTLPEGVTVEYTGGGTDVGTYSVSAKFYYKGKEIENSSLTKVLTITKATYDLSDIHLLSVTKIFDGKEVIPTLSGELPEGVTYAITVKNSIGDTIDKIVEVGVYTVYASFSSDNPNYYPTNPISATITVTPLSIEGITFNPVTLPYDGKPHSIAIGGTLPEGVRVEYEGGDKIAVGEYDITAKFFIGDTELVEERLTAKLTIVKADLDMSGVVVNDGSAEYTGKPHAPTLGGTLPEGVTVNYTYKNSLGITVNEIINVGTYTVLTTFVYDTDSYNEPDTITFNYTVTKASYDAGELYPSALTGVYNGKEHSPTLVGTLPSGVTVEYTYYTDSDNVTSEIIFVGQYTVIASFIYDEDNFEKLEPVTFLYTVTKASYDLSGITLVPVTKTYDGKPLALEIGTLPEGLEANILIKNSLGGTVDEIINAGSYTVTASFAGDYDNYNDVNDITVAVTVNKAQIVGISFSDTVFNYDGEAKSIFVTGAPEWLGINYTGNGKTDPGSYKVTATFTESENYLPIAPMTAKIIIKADKSSPTEGLIYEEYQGGYAVSGIQGDASVIVIPETYEGKSVLSVMSFAFDGNEKITYVYIPTSVVNIGNRAFSNCPNLATVEFGSIKVIGQQAFKNTAITEISLPESLESIGFAAFEGTRLEKLTLPFIGGSRHSSNSHLGFIFGGSTYAANATKIPETLKTVVISNGCAEIPAKAFYGASHLTEVVIGRSVAKIGNSAFQGCSSLREIYLPDSVASIPADFKPENSPFYGCAPDMMIVVESVDSIVKWGRYFAHLTDTRSAFIIYGKTYEDYIMNKDSYRDFDATDATLSALFVGSYLVDNFNPSVLEYTVDADISKALPTVDAIGSTPGTSVMIEQASSANGSTATITATSLDGENTVVYKVKFNLTGSFDSSAEVVGKDGSKGTVTFVIDDGYTPTATFMKSMMEKYASLAVTYAVYTKNFLTTSETLATDNGLIIEDTDGDGMMEYVLDENGKYTYVRNEEVIDFWRDILSVGRSEIIAHSHTHAFWGVNDEGGGQLTASTKNVIGTRIWSSLAEGSATKEVYASTQIVKDIFGELAGKTYVNAGIPPTGDDVTVTEEVSVYVSKQTVRLLYDTPVRVEGGKVYVDSLTWVNLQSTVGTIPAGTDFTTTIDASDGILPADTPILLPSDYITVPVLDNEGNQNVVRGFKTYLDELYRKAYEDGTFIGARTSGQVVYTPEDFTDLENRIYRRAYIIATSTNDPALPDSWKSHIDRAIAADGGWASFCIHAMTEDVNEDGQGAHHINWAQAEALFSYAAEKGSDLWIATQTDATLYYHEWSTSTVTSSYDDEANSITVTLTDKENDEVYTMPLTVKVAVPGNWTKATAGDKTLAVKLDDDGSCYVLVDVAPETTVTLIGG